MMGITDYRYCYEDKNYINYFREECKGQVLLPRTDPDVPNVFLDNRDYIR